MGPSPATYALGDLGQDFSNCHVKMQIWRPKGWVGPWILHFPQAPGRLGEAYTLGVVIRVAVGVVQVTHTGTAHTAGGWALPTHSAALPELGGPNPLTLKSRLVKCFLK